MKAGIGFLLGLVFSCVFVAFVRGDVIVAIVFVVIGLALLAALYWPEPKQRLHPGEHMWKYATPPAPPHNNQSRARRSNLSLAGALLKHTEHAENDAQFDALIVAAVTLMNAAKGQKQ